MPMSAIFEALADIGYQHFVDLELENHEDNPLPDVLKSFTYMRKLISDMGDVAACTRIVSLVQACASEMLTF